MQSCIGGQRFRKDAYNRTLIAINVIGFILSMYAYHVSVSKKSEASYRALCDISETMSCSRVLTSAYSIGFGFMGRIVGESSFLNQSNSVVGMLHYILLGLLSLSNNVSCTKVHLVLAILSNIASVYLAGVLIILRDFCLVCVLTYVVNAINFLLVYQKMQQQTQGFQKKKE